MRTLVCLLFLCVSASAAFAQVTPPASGVELPEHVIQSVREKGPGAFEFRNAWIAKTRTIRETRERFVRERGFYQRDLIARTERERMSVTGTFAIPVFAVKYVDTGADPYPVSTLQASLFDGPHSPRTLAEFYSEISYGDITVTGTVYGWTTLPEDDAYYAGPDSCNGLCGSANVGDLIVTALDLNDGGIDFGDYDSDGPDGVPNSGDDDGYVDFVAFVHPEAGAECGPDGNIWSHRWVLSGWTGSVYVTDDPRTGGGSILINDYVIQPALNCDAVTPIAIGVFCHEFGHAFGLPDLYDTNGGSQGVGHWCLMGSGSWNTPANPAHMSAWSKDQLGWADVVVVEGKPTNYDIYNVENNRAVYRLDVAHERWRRLSGCGSSNDWMKCGLSAIEAAARNWDGGAGYGNEWDETVSREFLYNGAGAVALTFDYDYDLEPGYDYVFGQIEVDGTTSTFGTYTGNASGVANIDLTPYLSGPGPYRVLFRMTSDIAWSDEDGLFNAPCAAFSFDDVFVTGGGENYFTDFETREDGWAQDMEVPNERFLVENRQPLGSDVNVWGGGGLAVWHIDESITRTGQSGNTGGPSNDRPRGVALEQADGLFELEDNVNRGSTGDPFPGSTSNMLFSSATTPSSNGNGGATSHASIALVSGNGDPITATLTGGWPAPTVSLFAPVTAESGDPVQLQIDGSAFARVGSAELVDGVTTIPSTSMQWLGKDRVLADFDLTGAPNGDYDLVVYNPGGSCAVVADAFEVTGAPTTVDTPVPTAFALRANYPNPFNPATTIRYDIASRADVSLMVYDVRGTVVRSLVNEVKAPGAYSVEWDGRNDQGEAVSSGVYFYKLTAPAFSDVRKMVLVK